MVEDLIQNYQKAEITEREKAMLRYAKKLSKKPSSLSKEDIKKLKEFNLSDRDILDLNQVTAYFNYVNRTADGLGIELEEKYKD